MKVLVIGCGSIGARHIRNLRTIGITDILVTDPATERLHQIASENQCQAVASLSAGLAEKPQAVLICTPPSLHMAVAKAAVEAGAHCFIEKPISDRQDGLKELLSLAAARGKKIMVGYVLRFDPAFREAQNLLSKGLIGRVFYVRAELGTYLPDWRPWQDYRQSYTAQRAMGGGVLLDASHELDLVRSVMGEVKSVFCACGTLGGIGIEVEDTAEITLWFESGALGSVHLDMVQHSRTRYCKFVGTQGTILVDFQDSTVKCFRAETKEWSISFHSKDGNQPYIEELQHFFTCIQENIQPIVSGLDGKAAMQIALAARESGESGKTVQLLA